MSGVIALGAEARRVVASEVEPDASPIATDEAALPEMDESEAAAFRASIAEGIADGDAGRTMPADLFLAALRARYV